MPLNSSFVAFLLIVVESLILLRNDDDDKNLIGNFIFLTVSKQ